MRRWYHATTDAERASLYGEVPYAGPPQLQAWPMHRVSAQKMGEYHVYALADGAQKLRYVQIDDVGHEVPLISREKFAELLREMLAWSPAPAP